MPEDGLSSFLEAYGPCAMVSESDKLSYDVGLQLLGNSVRLMDRKVSDAAWRLHGREAEICAKSRASGHQLSGIVLLHLLLYTHLSFRSLSGRQDSKLRTRFTTFVLITKFIYARCFDRAVVSSLLPDLHRLRCFIHISNSISVRKSHDTRSRS
jgi:hypothetical protein